MKTSKKVITGVFLAVSVMLYYLILTASGDLLRWSEFSAILLCFLFALANAFFSDKLLSLGLLFTCFADYCLVICKPIEQLSGMVFFLAVQLIYGIKLYVNKRNKPVLIARIVVTLLSPLVVFMALGSKIDALSVISVCYYINLVFNIISAFMSFSKNRLFAIGLVLFLLCDTVIGLQVASKGYLPIVEGSLLHKIIFPDFNLAWLFYLPSQVLIALSSLKNTTKKPQ